MLPMSAIISKNPQLIQLHTSEAHPGLVAVLNVIGKIDFNIFFNDGFF